MEASASLRDKLKAPLYSFTEADYIAGCAGGSS